MKNVNNSKARPLSSFLKLEPFFKGNNYVLLKLSFVTNYSKILPFFVLAFVVRKAYLLLDSLLVNWNLTIVFVILSYYVCTSIKF